MANVDTLLTVGAASVYALAYGVGLWMRSARGLALYALGLFVVLTALGAGVAAIPTTALGRTGFDALNDLLIALLTAIACGFGLIAHAARLALAPRRPALGPWIAAAGSVLAPVCALGLLVAMVRIGLR